MSKFILAAFTVAALGAASSTAYAGGWGCRTCDYLNGTKLTGVAIGGASIGTPGAVILLSGGISK